VGLKPSYTSNRQFFVLLQNQLDKDSTKFRNGALLHRYVSEPTVIARLEKRQGLCRCTNMDPILLGPIQLSGKRGLEHQPITRFDAHHQEQTVHLIGVLFVGLPVGYSLLFTRHPLQGLPTIEGTEINPMFLVDESLFDPDCRTLTTLGI
jgi:hypothetical protein